MSVMPEIDAGEHGLAVLRWLGSKWVELKTVAGWARVLQDSKVAVRRREDRAESVMRSGKREKPVGRGN